MDSAPDSLPVVLCPGCGEPMHPEAVAPATGSSTTSLTSAPSAARKRSARCGAPEGDRSSRRESRAIPIRGGWSRTEIALRRGMRALVCRSASPMKRASQMFMADVRRLWNLIGSAAQPRPIFQRLFEIIGPSRDAARKLLRDENGAQPVDLGVTPSICVHDNSGAAGPCLQFADCRVGSGGPGHLVELYRKRV